MRKPCYVPSDKFKCSSYTLTATPYGNKNFERPRGGPLTFNFSVTSNAHTCPIATQPSKAQLAHFYLNPVPGDATVGLDGLKNSRAYNQLVDSFGNFFPGTTEKLKKERMPALQWDAAFLRKADRFLLINTDRSTVTFFRVISSR